MNTRKYFLLVVVGLMLLTGCDTLAPVVVSWRAPITKNYKYVRVAPTSSISTTGVDPTAYILLGAYVPTSNSVNPADVISGYFMRRGFAVVQEINPERAEETLIVTYGESGSRPFNFGTATEITIQILSAKTGELLCSCTAEGYGDTLADDIRQAIKRALDEIFGVQ